MTHTLMLWGMRVFQYLFFAGLAGCVIVVSVCWVRIGKDSVSKDTASDT